MWSITPLILMILSKTCIMLEISKTRLGGKSRVEDVEVVNSYNTTQDL